MFLRLPGLCCNEVFLVSLEPSGEGPVTGYYPARHRNITAFPLNVLTFLVIEIYLLLDKKTSQILQQKRKSVLKLRKGLTKWVINNAARPLCRGAWDKLSLSSL